MQPDAAGGMPPNLGAPDSNFGFPSQLPTSLSGMHEDERFQEILRQKREEYRKELEDQVRSKEQDKAARNGQAQSFVPGQGLAPQSSQAQPASGPGISEAEQRRLQREEYKRELDA